MKHFILILALFFSFLSNANAQGEIPNKPKEQRLVNDLADVLSPREEFQLEAKLLDYFKKTSTQIAVVTVKSLNGYERADFATRLAQKWGIGSVKKDNGILLLIKPKYRNSRGIIQIATGYGLEGAATDLACGQIRDNVLIPAFKKNNYFEGINKGTDALIALTKGEYNEAVHAKRPMKINFVLIIFLLFVVFSLFTAKSKSRNTHQMGSRGSNLPFWLLLGMLSNNRGGRGGFSDFNSGGGSFGDFGGFGGGSFGGGGAGGNW